MVLLLSLFDIVLVCTSVVLLFIPLAKWYKKQRFKAQHRTLFNDFMGTLQRLQIICLKKASLDGYFKLTTDISLKSVA